MWTPIPPPQAAGYIRARNRRKGASSRAADPVGAGLYHFCGVRWLDPDADARLLADGLARMEEAFPHLRGATTPHHLQAVLRRTRAAWAPHAAAARTLHATARCDEPRAARPAAERGPTPADSTDGELPPPRRPAAPAPRARAGRIRAPPAGRAAAAAAAASAAATFVAACGPVRRSPRKRRPRGPREADGAPPPPPPPPAAPPPTPAGWPAADPPPAAAPGPGPGDEEWGGVLAAWEAAAAECREEWAGPGLLSPCE
jgi:hypothetical protein